jgi:hypothetical protein
MSALVTDTNNGLKKFEVRERKHGKRGIRTRWQLLHGIWWLSGESSNVVLEDPVPTTVRA